MNKIVLEHYPAERPPADLRAGLPADARVRVTVESEAQIKPIRNVEEFFALRKPPFRTMDDIVRESIEDPSFPMRSISPPPNTSNVRPF